MTPIDVPIAIPSMLHANTGGRSEVIVSAATIQQAIDALLKAYPILENNLYESPGKLRQHVWIFYNEDNTRWMDSLDVPLKPGDRLTVLQAVSGG